MFGGSNLEQMKGDTYTWERFYYVGPFELGEYGIHYYIRYSMAWHMYQTA